MEYKSYIAEWIAHGLNVLPIRLIENDNEIDKQPMIKKGVLTDVYNGRVFLGNYAIDRKADAYAICLTAIWKDNKANFEEWIVGIDCDDQVLSEAIDIIMPDTSKQKSKRGYHWLFIITEDIREYVKDKDNGKESYAKPVKVNDFKVEVYLGKRYFVTIGKGYEVIKDIDSIAKISYEEFMEIRSKIEKLLMLIDTLKSFYKEGNRNDIDFALEGIFAKSNVSKEEAERYIKAICHYFNDNELNSRLTVLDRTYKRVERGEEVAGISALAKIIGKDKALKIAKLFGKDISEIKESSLISKLENLYRHYTEPYDLVCNLLLKEVNEGKEEAQFIKDYVFVTKREADREDNKGSWYRYLGHIWKKITPYEISRKINDYIDKKIDILNEELNEELAIYQLRLEEADEKEKEKIEAEIKATEKRYMFFIKMLNKAKGSGKRVSETIHTMEANFDEFSIYEDQLDNYPNSLSINTRTHLIVWNEDIKDFIAIEHGEKTKHYYITKYANINYNKEAKCDKFVNWLKYVSNNDKDLAMFLATLAGSCLFDRIDHKCIINFGGGSNGKSTFMKVLLDILNSSISGYSSISGVNIVGYTKNSKEDSYQPDLFKVVNKRLVAVDEPNQIIINAGKLKSVTSQGEIMLRTLFMRPEIIKPTFTLLIFTNKKPLFTDTTYGTMRRIIMIKWKVEISKNIDIKDYHNILLEEREGIFNLLLAGARKFIINGFDLEKIAPESVKITTDEYRYNLNVIHEFLNTRFVYEQNYMLEFKQVYDMYIKFCEEKDIPENARISKRKFAEVVEEHNMYKVNKNGVVYLTNYKPVDSNTITDFNNNNNGNNGNNNGFENKNDSKPNAQGNYNNGKKDRNKLALVITKKGLKKLCPICEEIKPNGISTNMFIAKHKCFRENKNIEVKILDNNNNEWIYTRTLGEKVIRNEYACSKCNYAVEVGIDIPDEVTFEFLTEASKHECNNSTSKPSGF